MRLSPVRFRLRELREQLGVSQTELAKRTQLRQSTISDIETGKTVMVALDTIDKLCAALGCTPAELLEYEPEKKGKRK